MALHQGHQCLSAECLHWPSDHAGRGIRRRLASPMPFGGVPSLAHFVFSRGVDPQKASPMPFGGVPSLAGEFSIIISGEATRSHQCLSAECLHWPRNGNQSKLAGLLVTNAFRRSAFTGPHPSKLLKVWWSSVWQVGSRFAGLMVGVETVLGRGFVGSNSLSERWLGGQVGRGADLGDLRSGPGVGGAAALVAVV